tara:strand:- start:643 stop:828 length:186 start_codon:yes stop_codon:yes gene_type:complete
LFFKASVEAVEYVVHEYAYSLFFHRFVWLYVFSCFHSWMLTYISFFILVDDTFFLAFAFLV